MSRRFLGVVAGAVLVGLGLGLRFPVPAQVEFAGGGAFLPSPERELEALIGIVPFDARLPARVPKGLSLYEIGDSGPDADGLTHSFDVKYRSRTDPKRNLHIWQGLVEDPPDLLKNDPQEGVPVLEHGRLEIDGSPWWLVKLDWPNGIVTELGHRFNDGVTLTVDTQGLTTAQLMDVARSLTIVRTISSEWLVRLGLIQSKSRGG